MDALHEAREYVRSSNNVIGDARTEDNAMLFAQLAQAEAQIAQAEALTRIADVLESAASDGIRIERERGE